MTRTARRAFTLIELLVVVAIIALLISILLPSLRCARESARTAKCGALLHALGNGIQTYATESKDWIPGTNTSGATFAIGLLQAGSGGVNYLRSTRLAVQRYDWISPFLSTETALGENRAKRFRTIVNTYLCPSQGNITVDSLYDSPPSIDAMDFAAEGADWRPLSYLMPAQFQAWGETSRGQNHYWNPSTFSGVPVWNPSLQWEYKMPTYKSRVTSVGTAARKIAVADGTRYLDQNRELDFDITPSGNQFGSFTDPGGWWGGSQAYGVQSGTLNWDNSAVAAGSPDALGEAMPLSYRHGCVDRSKKTNNARQNEGSINAMFFDGHVQKLADRQSREISYWYPSGTIITKPNEGLTTVPMNFVVP
ncbi:MAG: prepilin-type N-terminal cleavage/methylation domain-containing protein [Phycisphaerae bacterium]